MIFSTLILSSLLMQGPQIEWVVRDVVPPRQLNDNYFFTVGPTWPFGGSAQEGVTNWVRHNQFQPEPWSGLVGRTDLSYYSGIGPPAVARTLANPELSTSSGTWATLGTPSGMQLLIERTNSLGLKLVSFDAATGQELGVAVLPTNLPNGAPDPPQFETLYAAGDINGDGYEDCFWSTYSSNVLAYAYFGLLDGATLTVPWVRAYSGGANIVPMFWEPSILPDLTGDGHADFFVGVARFGSNSHTWVLLSGVDGLEAWSETASGINVFYFPYGRDISGDGSPDAVVREDDGLRGISAKDGVELWRSPLAPLWNSAGQNQRIYEAAGAGGIHYSHSIFSTGGEQAVYPVTLQNLSGTGLDNRIGFGHFNGADGAFLGVFFAPGNLEPWSTDYLLTSPMLFPIGDYDRDGLAEWYVANPDPANTPPLFANMGQYSDRMVILGQRTLFVPDTHPFSTFYFQMDIAIPSAPNKDYLVLFSTAFDASGGLEMEKWQTQLGVSPVLDYTFQQRQYAGTLDADGQATTYVIIPPYTPLIGSTLYSRAIILNAPGSAERIWTISSLGVTEIQ